MSSVKTLTTRARTCQWCRLSEPEAKFDRRQGKRANITRMPPSTGSTCDDCHYWKMTLRKFGLTIPDYLRILEDQKGVCASCGEEETNTYRGKLRRLAIDHDHSCCPGNQSCGKCIRALVCSCCNSILGFAQDDLEVLQKIIDYLKKHAVNTFRHGSNY